MLLPYLLIFNRDDGPRQEILDYLDTRREVKNWFAFLPDAIFIISDSDALTLSNLFSLKFPSRYFLITEVPAGKNNGWLIQRAWDFINNPKSSGRWS
jgi:hypothetical protein